MGEFVAHVADLINQSGGHVVALGVREGESRVVIHGSHEDAKALLLELDGVRIRHHTLLGKSEQVVDEGIKCSSTLQRLEEKLAGDGTLAIREDLLSLHGLAHDFTIDTD